MADALTYSVADAAAALGVSERLVYELIERGDMPAIELGRRKVIPRRAIELLMDRAVEGFDPERVLTGLAGAARSSDVIQGTGDVEERTGTTGSTTDSPLRPPAVAAPAASVVPIR